MAALVVPFFLQFENEVGIPYAGGFIYTYAAGTNTPKATYTDFTETVNAPNPIPLDSAGRCTIWGNGSYKFVLTDALGNIIKTTDNVTTFSVPAASANSYFQSFSGNGSQTAFPLTSDLGTDPKALIVFVDQGAGKGYDAQNPNAFTLTSGVSPVITFAVPPAAGTNNIYVFAPSLLLGAASSAASQAAASASQAAASAILASAASLSGTSTTSVTIGTGVKNFITQLNKNYTPGAWLTIASAANVGNYMFGQISTYNSATGALAITVPTGTNTTGGSGTFADWIINIAGVQGVNGSTGSGAVNMQSQTYVSGIGFTGGSSTQLTLTNTPIALSSAALFVVFDGVIQQPSEWTYNVATGVITFNSAIPLGVSAVYCYWFRDISVGTPTTGSVLKSSLDSAALYDTVTTTSATTYVMVTTDQEIDVDASGGAKAITLQNAATFPGRRVLIRKTDTSLNAVTLTGLTTLNTQNEAVEIQSNGTVWRVISRYGTLTEWVNYIPLATNLGTGITFSIRSRRNGDSLELMGYFTNSVIGAAAEARLSLGFAAQEATFYGGLLTGDSTKIPAVTVAGHGSYSVSTISIPIILCEPSIGYITFGVGTASAAGYMKANGSVLMSSAPISLGFIARIPITGWKA